MRSLSLPLFLLGLAVPASAQQRAAADSARRDTTRVELTPIEVVGSIQPFAGPRIGSGVPGRVTVLSGQQLERWEPRLLTDALQQQPGISLYDDLGTPYKLNLQYRGFFASPVVGIGQGLAVFLDGTRQNEPDAAQVNWDLLPMEHVKRVELLSGTSSLLGRNALAGAINLVTARGETERPELSLEAMGGMFGAWSGEGSIGQKLGNGWDYYAGGGYNRERGWRQATEAEQLNGFVNVGRETAERGIRFQLYGARSDVRTAGSLPRSVFGVRPDSNLTANDFEDLLNVQAAVRGFTRVGDGRASFNVFVRRHQADRFNANQELDADSYSESRNTTIGGTFDYRWGGLVGGREVGLRIGVDGGLARSTVDLFEDEVKFGGDRDLETSVRANIADGAVFALGDVRFGRVLLSAGARYDLVRLPFENLTDPSLDETRTFRAFNPKGGVLVDAGRGVSLYANVGRTFRAPALIELACVSPLAPCPLPFALGDDKRLPGAKPVPGDPIEPVRATTWESGFRVDRGGLAVTGSVYRADVANEIALFPNEAAPSGSTIEGTFVNLEATRRQGVELGLNYQFPQGHYLYANYSYTEATFRVDDVELFSIREEFGGENEVDVGDRIPLVPDHQVKVGGGVQLPAGFAVGADVRYIGRQFLRGDEANEEAPLDRYVVTDARLGWEGGDWEVSAIVNNVFQARYATFGTFNVNQGGGGILERFLTPGHVRMLRLVVRRKLTL